MQFSIGWPVGAVLGPLLLGTVFWDAQGTPGRLHLRSGFLAFALLFLTALVASCLPCLYKVSVIPEGGGVSSRYSPFTPSMAWHGMSTGNQHCQCFPERVLKKLMSAGQMLGSSCLPTTTCNAIPWLPLSQRRVRESDGFSSP